MESETSELERLRGVPSPPASLGPQLGCEGGVPWERSTDVLAFQEPILA